MHEGSVGIVDKQTISTVVVTVTIWIESRGLTSRDFLLPHELLDSFRNKSNRGRPTNFTSAQRSYYVARRIQFQRTQNLLPNSSI